MAAAFRPPRMNAKQATSAAVQIMSVWPQCAPFSTTVGANRTTAKAVAGINPLPRVRRTIS